MFNFTRQTLPPIPLRTVQKNLTLPDFAKFIGTREGHEMALSGAQIYANQLMAAMVAIENAERAHKSKEEISRFETGANDLADSLRNTLADGNALLLSQAGKLVDDTRSAINAAIGVTLKKMGKSSTGAAKK